MNCSFGSEDSVCGPFGANSTILPLVKCEEDMTSHLISLGVTSYIYICSGMVHFKVNLIFLIKITELKKKSQ